MASCLWRGVASLLHMASRCSLPVEACFSNCLPRKIARDGKLPAIDVFICTADPSKEPTVEVMNTVLSAMTLDYPPEKLHVYLSDDGGSSLTLYGMKETWSFAREWLPFCTRYGIKTRCPKAYFQVEENDARSTKFIVESQRIKVKYEWFKESVKRAREDGENQEISRDHSPEIEVIQGNFSDEVKMPSLVYVSREKRPDRPHHFKAGALNALTQWWGFDALEGPCISGTGLYVKRRSLYVASVDKKDDDLMVLRPSFGQSSEFVNSLGQNYMPNLAEKDAMMQQTKLVVSCDYEINTLWGEDVGFMYFSVAEDYFTGFTLHCRGWISAFLDPPRPQFLGSGTTNLNDVLIQGTRWSSGLVEVGISRFCPHIWGIKNGISREHVLWRNGFKLFLLLTTTVLCYHSSTLSTQWHCFIPGGFKSIFHGICVHLCIVQLTPFIRGSL